ncbi:MAG: hypothetical protein ACTS6J_07185 [Burkholderiales bacterium]
MSDQCKVYQRRPADDGGEYLLMPRDDDFPGQSMAPGIPGRIGIPMSEQPQCTPKVESSAEVEAMVDTFFASLNKAG